MITIVGTMNLPEIPLQEVVLHNKIMKNIAPVRNVEYDLNYVNDVIFPSLQKTVPQVQKDEDVCRRYFKVKGLFAFYLDMHCWCINERYFFLSFFIIDYLSSINYGILFDKRRQSHLCGQHNCTYFHSHISLGIGAFVIGLSQMFSFFYLFLCLFLMKVDWLDLSAASLVIVVDTLLYMFYLL